MKRSKNPEKVVKGPFIDKVIFLFNEAGNQFEETNYDSAGNLLRKYTYSYDDKGKLIARDYYIPELDWLLIRPSFMMIKEIKPK